MSCLKVASRTTWLLAVSSCLVACAGDEEPVYKKCPVPLSGAPVRGPADAWVTIVEFADFQCGFCQQAQASIAEVEALRPNLRWSFRHFPLSSIHAYATSAGSAADCANEQGQFWAMHDALFAEAGISLTDAALAGAAEAVGLDMVAWEACFESNESLARIEADFQLGLDFGVKGTPTFFINDRVLFGAYPAEDFVRTIDDAEDEARASGIPASEYYETLHATDCNE